MDTGCPMPSSPPRARELTPRTVPSIAPANAFSALGSLCWSCLLVKSVPERGSDAVAIQYSAWTSHYGLASTVYLCLP